ncbi:MAG: nickel-dependent lactate racemase [Desulfosarcinaceae bacterium]|nr:nickel-dependent lactate racemase [Desulfosarcinaceae bacterium]
MKIDLKKGRGTVSLIVPDAEAIQRLSGPEIPALTVTELQSRVRRGIRAHLPAGIEGQNVAILIPDDTRLWARGDLVVPQLVATLRAAGVREERLTIIIALGTHAAIPSERISRLTGRLDVQRCRVLNSANRDRSRLVHMGRTSRGTPVDITREAVAADHIIIFGGMLHHLLAGYGGGRKYILPGIAGYDSVQQNHALAITATGAPHPRVGPAILAGNPVHEDLEEAADIFLEGKSCTYVAVAANGKGELFYCRAGALRETFRDGCARLDAACSVPLPQQADFAVISAGGHRTDGQLYQATKALFNAARAVKAGGRILFVAGCAEGVGNALFADALISHKDAPAALGRQLCEDFSMPAYVALRVMDLLKRYRVTLVSDLAPDRVHALGFDTTADPQATLDQLRGRGIVIPFAENILPRPGTDDHR